MTDTMTMLDIALDTSPRAWFAAIEALSDEERRAFERSASDCIDRLALFVGYIRARGAYGNGDSGHDAGVSRGNILRRQARRMLGYSYPRGGEFTF